MSHQQELAPSLPGLMAQSQKFLDTASFHESTSRDEPAWALQVSCLGSFQRILETLSV